MGSRLPVVVLLVAAAWGALISGSTDAVSRGEREGGIDDFFRRHAGVRYGFGQCTLQAMDCSCFAQKLYRELWGTSIPRSTLTQTSWLRTHRVPEMQTAGHLHPERLCVGDLIYTYQGRGWQSGSRHVAIYAGNGNVVHASKKNRGVGRDNLRWVQRFSLYGVYRPLNCEAPGPRRETGTYSNEEVQVQHFVGRYYATWMTGDLPSYRQFWAADAQQVLNGQTLDREQIVNHRRKNLEGLSQGTAYHDIRSLGITGNRAFVDVDYALHRQYHEHRREDLNRRETLILQRENGRWKIVFGEDPAGE